MISSMRGCTRESIGGTPRDEKFDPSPTLEGALVVLTPLRVDDAVMMAEVLGDPDIYGWIGGAPPTAERLRTVYAELERGMSRDRTEIWLNWVIRRKPELVAVGTVQATIFNHGQRAEVAWIISPRWQRMGLATAAADAMIEWLYPARVQKVTAHIHPDHVASERVAQHVGLAPTGRLHDGEREWELGVIYR